MFTLGLDKLSSTYWCGINYHMSFLTLSDVVHLIGIWKRLRRRKSTVPRVSPLYFPGAWNEIGTTGYPESLLSTAVDLFVFV